MDRATPTPRSLIQVMELLNTFLSTTKEKNILSLEFYETMEGKNAKVFRNQYDVIDRINEIKENDNDILRYVDDIVQKINDIKDEFRTHIEHLENIGKIINRGKIGTLEGLARDAVKKADITTDNPAIQSVLEQPYDELAAVRKPSGGRKKRRKTRKRRY